jgi:hypothetical protein
LQVIETDGTRELHDEDVEKNGSSRGGNEDETKLARTRSRDFERDGAQRSRVLPPGGAAAGR